MTYELGSQLPDRPLDPPEDPALEALAEAVEREVREEFAREWGDAEWWDNTFDSWPPAAMREVSAALAAHMRADSCAVRQHLSAATTLITEDAISAEVDRRLEDGE